MGTYRIRRCNGNHDAWLLARVNADGTDADSYGSFVTSYSIDGLLDHPRGKHLRPEPGGAIELILD